MKLNKITLAAAMLTTLGLSTTAMAASQASLNVTGTMKPPSCDINFDGGAEMDFGEINSASLSADKSTALTSKATKLNVSCGAPTLFAIKATDTAELAGEAPIDGKVEAYNFSLGATSEGKSIGAFRVQTNKDQSLVDGVAATRVVSSFDNGESWSSVPKKIWSNGPQLIAVTAGTAALPSAAKSVVMDIAVTPYIAPRANLGSGDKVTLAGNTTFDLVYL
ncbi:DUF1120 domain-containing protein [Erwinia sp. AnSW2-5]|uniref:DUF1120 domain-containing protein n=1 Tax=Erwinia sp. AnSW2-5 TaxID=3367692 RepID=UPI00385A0FAA